MNYRILEKENSWFVPQYRWWGIWRCWAYFQSESIVGFLHQDEAEKWIKKTIKDEAANAIAKKKTRDFKSRVVYEVMV